MEANMHVMNRFAITMAMHRTLVHFKIQATQMHNGYSIQVWVRKSKMAGTFTNEHTSTQLI